jgi:hypothetical protein
MKNILKYLVAFCLLFFTACGKTEKNNNQALMEKETTRVIVPQVNYDNKQFVKMDSVYNLIVTLRVRCDTLNDRRTLGSTCSDTFYDMIYLPKINETEISRYNKNYVESKNNMRSEHQTFEHKSYVVALLCKIKSSDKYIGVLRSSIENDGKYIFVFLKKYEEKLYVIRINSMPVQIVGENIEYINSVLSDEITAFLVIKTNTANVDETQSISVYRATLWDNSFGIDEMFFTTITNPLKGEKTDSLKIELINYEQMIRITQLRRELIQSKKYEWNIVAMDTIK